MFSKIVDIITLSDIKDNSIIAISGFNMATTPEYLILELYRQIMTAHKGRKCIIHTTSYEQLNFIKQNISKLNQRRLLETNPDVERDEIINEHFKSSKPTVLISPSLQLGLDLKDHLSRFQVITKVPYPSLGDRWIDEKRKRSEQWYSWQTGLSSSLNKTGICFSAATICYLKNRSLRNGITLTQKKINISAIV